MNNCWKYTGSSGQTGTGYVSSSYIRIPVSYSADANFEAYLTSQGFPESYKDGLRQLHAQYPNWVFRAKNTGIDWNTAVENESVLGRNLVATGSISSWKSVESGAYMIATGGLGKIIADETECIDLYDPQLTLNGLRMIHEKVQKKR